MHGSCLLEQNTGAGALSTTPLMGNISQKYCNTRLLFEHVVVWLHPFLLLCSESCCDQRVKGKDVLRAGEGHQSSADHNEVQNIPQVTKIRARVEEQSQVNHLQSQNKQEQNKIMIITSQRIIQTKCKPFLCFNASYSELFPSLLQKSTSGVEHSLSTAFGNRTECSQIRNIKPQTQLGKPLTWQCCMLGATVVFPVGFGDG